jgi:hypothetical protein
MMTLSRKPGRVAATSLDRAIAPVFAAALALVFAGTVAAAEETVVISSTLEPAHLEA